MTKPELLSALAGAPQNAKWSEMPAEVRAAVDVSRLNAFYGTDDLPVSQIMYHLRTLRTDDL
jgi:hypothetical protein